MEGREDLGGHDRSERKDKREKMRESDRYLRREITNNKYNLAGRKDSSINLEILNFEFL